MRVDSSAAFTPPVKSVSLHLPWSAPPSQPWHTWSAEQSPPWASSSASYRNWSAQPTLLVFCLICSSFRLTELAVALRSQDPKHKIFSAWERFTAERELTSAASSSSRTWDTLKSQKMMRLIRRRQHQGIIPHQRMQPVSSSTVDQFNSSQNRQHVSKRDTPVRGIPSTGSQQGVVAVEFAYIFTRLFCSCCAGGVFFLQL